MSEQPEGATRGLLTGFTVLNLSLGWQQKGGQKVETRRKEGPVHCLDSCFCYSTKEYMHRRQTFKGKKNSRGGPNWGQKGL